MGTDCKSALSGNVPINAVDPDGGDIIYLNDSNAVNPTGMGAFGHAAVLIGNDKDGWRYLSMNGTAKNRGDGGKMFGDSQHGDLGDTKGQNDFRGTGLTAKQVMKSVNTSNKKITSHNYDRAVRIKTSGFEDEIAYQAAKKQASNKTYSIFGSSCIDVPQSAFASVVASRLDRGKDISFHNTQLNFFQENNFGFHILTPNDWYESLLGTWLNNFMNNINSAVDNNFDYYEVHESPRYK